MNKITYFAVAALAMAAMYATTASAVVITTVSGTNTCAAVSSTDRYVYVQNSMIGGFCATQEGNFNGDDFSGFLGGGLFMLDKDIAPDGMAEGSLFYSGSTFGDWSISSSAWNSYDRLFIAFHFGQGSGSPDSFIVELDTLATGGNWSFLPEGLRNGLSNIYLLGLCETATGANASCTPDRDVPEPGTLGLLGLGLAGLGFGMRRRRKI